jgi:HPt (histidine-containing phosphotransfer) domain-containing protein
VDTEGILDESALLKLVGDDRDLARQMADLFLDDPEPRVNEITAAVREQDPERLRRAAHALAGRPVR